jgi:hypothetical protein
MELAESKENADLTKRAFSSNSMLTLICPLISSAFSCLQKPRRLWRALAKSAIIPANLKCLNSTKREVTRVPQQISLTVQFFAIEARINEGLQ